MLWQFLLQVAVLYWLEDSSAATPDKSRIALKEPAQAYAADLSSNSWSLGVKHSQADSSVALHLTYHTASFVAVTAQLAGCKAGV